MKTLKLTIIYLFTAMCSLMAVSCADDFPYQNVEIPEGDGTLSATVTFTPTSATSLGGSRTSGDAIQTINSLCVLVYTTDGNLVETYSYVPDDGSGVDPNSDLEDYVCNQEGYEVKKDNDFLPGGDNPHTDETATPQASFKLPGLPYGKYHIYAVANMGDLETDEKEFVDNEGKSVKIKDAIQTENGLKSIKCTWNSEVIKSNDQMFGTFTQENSSNIEVDFKPGNAKIHAWVRRLASKVTVAYDGSGLKPNVWIYIKNVTIHDIPAYCTLGEGNKIEDEKYLLNRRTNNLPTYEYNPDTDNTRIDYTKDYPGTNHIYYKDIPGIEIYNGLVTVQGDPILKPNTIKDGDQTVAYDPHGPDAESLFFYENNQGDYEGQEQYDKRQKKPIYDENGNKINDGVGQNVREPETKEDGATNDYKDRLLCGTYIEVEAYYVSTNSENPSEGNIKYRFMLGKNVTYNYDAQRNYHFKVTLGFKGWANQPDWHIDYEEPEPSIEVAPVFRISYLYHEKAMMPVKIAGNCTKLTVTIIENNWAPYDPNTDDHVAAPEVTGGGPAMYDFKWNKAAYTDSELNGVQKPYLGFLALRMPDDYMNHTAIPTYVKDGSTVIYDFNQRDEAQEALKQDYEGKKQYIRVFEQPDLSIKVDPYDAGSPNEYYVNNVPDDKNQRILMMPLWTRARTMIEGSGFSGNNPYEYYERKARLKIEGTFRITKPDGTVTEETLPAEYVDVLQVPRIVNPKGVWKSADSKDKTFHVLLKEAKSPNGMSDFKNLVSVGDWSASIEGSGATLSKSPTTIGDIESGTIKGKTGTEVDFNIDFSDDPGYAIVTVLYHGNNCVHKIFVRKGFDTMVNMGDNEWSSFSLYATKLNSDGKRIAILTKNPLALGSYFRRGRLDKAILVHSNSLNGLGPLEAPDGKDFLLYDRYAENWAEIGYVNEGETNKKNMGSFFSEDGEIEYKVPSLADFQALTSVKNNYQFGYGVLYGEGAHEPADEAEIAYRLFDVENVIPESDCGMRGVIVYDPIDGDQIFFPIGAYGMGRRTQFNIGVPNNETNPRAGMLRYADVSDPLVGSKDTDKTADGKNNNNCFRPVPYNLPIAPGAIYWIDEWTPNAHLEGGKYYPSMGWDINYFNYDFNSYTQNNFRDACVIKLIKKK